MQTLYKRCLGLDHVSGDILDYLLISEERFWYYLSFGIYLSQWWNLIKVRHFRFQNIFHSLYSEYLIQWNTRPPERLTPSLQLNSRKMLENFLVPSWAQWPDVEKNNGKLSAIDFCQSHIETHLTQCISLLLILRFLWCSILKYEFKHQIFSNCLNLSRGFFFSFFMPICCFTKLYETNELFLIKLVNLFDLTCWIVHSFA